MKSKDPPELTRVVGRNIRAMRAVREEFVRRKRFDERLAARITRSIGTMPFIYVQIGIVAGWIALNLRAVPSIRPWDPFPFTLLAMVASVEAMFLATLLLINQSHLQQLEDRRAELDLQINLLAEREITHLLEAVDAIAQRVGAEVHRPSELDALKREVAIEQVVEEIELAEEEASAAPPDTSRH